MIRIANQNDVQQIAQVHVQSWKETYIGIIRQYVIDELSVEQRIQLWQKLVIDQNHRIFVYEHEGQILGFLDGYLNPNNNIAEIKAFYFLKEIKGQGIGRTMFEKFHRFVGPQKHRILRLGVINKNPSRYFYEKMGGQAVEEKDASDLGEGITEVFYQWNIS